MKFWLPKEIGFCSGVKAAVDKALNVTGQAYCLGEIVHNEHVVRQLAEHGVITVNSVAEVPDGATMIIRAHGGEIFARNAGDRVVFEFTLPMEESNC